MSACDTQIVIIGGGLSGLTMGLRLAQSGFDVMCIERAARPDYLDHDNDIPSEPDRRTLAISYGSSKVLERAGVWDEMVSKGAAITGIDVLDSASPVLLHMDAGETEAPGFGWVIEAAHMLGVLRRAADKCANLEVIYGEALDDLSVEAEGAAVTLSSGRHITAQLVIGADGRGSKLRQLAGIQARSRSYHQDAIVCCVAHEHPHDGLAVEHFWPEGPFAILPRTDLEDGRHASAVVLTEHGGQGADSLMSLSDAEFEMALKVRFPERYGVVSLASERKIYPLGLVHAERYVGHRVALIADAAHGIHPIAGQGVNLGLRDVEALVKILDEAREAGDDIGSLEMLQGYQRARRADNMAMIAFTNTLNYVFSIKGSGAQVVRRLGMAAIRKFPRLKRFIVDQAMGTKTCVRSE